MMIRNAKACPAPREYQVQIARSHRHGESRYHATPAAPDVNRPQWHRTTHRRTGCDDKRYDQHPPNARGRFLATHTMRIAGSR
jgi:hypothetical protein